MINIKQPLTISLLCVLENVEHMVGDWKFFVVKHFIMVVTSVAVGGIPIPTMLLMNMVIQVTFHR